MSGPWESCSDTSPKTDAAKLDYHQISRDTNIDYRSVCEIIDDLYNGMLVHKKVKKYFPVVQVGGLRNESLFSINMFAIDSLSTPLHFDKTIKNHKNNFLIEIKKKNRKLFNKIFKF